MALSLLSDQAREFIGQSARPNTRRAYVAQLKQWLAWCADAGLPPFPAEPTRVANYLSERAVKGQSVSTLRTVVAAIKAGHDAQGLSFDSKAPAILRTLRGIHNANPKLAKQTEPIGEHTLERCGDDKTVVNRQDRNALAPELSPIRPSPASLQSILRPKRLVSDC